MQTRLSLATGLLAALLSSAALAQTSTDSNTTAPAATEPADTTTAPASEPSVTTAEPAAPAATSTTAFYKLQQGDLRASELIGKTVYNSAGENIGEINELVVNQSGQVAAVVLGIGGFLGMGERDVAVPFSSLKMVASTDGDEMRWTTDLNRDSLTNAPAWRWTME